MPKSLSSYIVERFEASDQALELNRLTRQAQVLVPPDHVFLNTVGLRPGMKVLDLGCGNGLTSCQIARELPLDELIAVDLSPLMVETAKTLQQQQGVNNVRFQQGDVYHLYHSCSFFDFVYSRLLFQHLTDSDRALAEVHRVLKPGGILCLIDIDHSWFSLFPEPEAFSELTRRLAVLQQAQGGDPWVGRKLGYFAHQAGFVNVQMQIEVVTSDQMGLEQFLSLLSFGTPYHSVQEGLREMATQARQAVYDLLSQPYAWAGVGIFVVTAHKP